jgi:hypothetical protein
VLLWERSAIVSLADLVFRKASSGWLEGGHVLFVRLVVDLLM